MEALREPGSFRDPSGFLFERDGVLLRQVHPRYASHYDRLMTSGLYEELVTDGLLIAHEEVSTDLAADPGAHRVLRPQRVPFVSYPYEWCFGQLRKAALLTLQIQERALARGLILKDASAFNIQFVGGRPLLIDTLSFENYEEGEPWIAYNQFCRHFLAPLELMSRADVRLSRLTSSFLEGVPLDLASGMLPRRSWVSFGTLLHLHLHARSVRRFSDTSRGTPSESNSSGRPRRGSVSRNGLTGLIESLRSSVRRTSWNPDRTVWADYEEAHAYSTEARAEKERWVGVFLDRIAPRRVLDLGANTGVFSRMARGRADYVIALDSDPGAVEKHFRHLQEEGIEGILPLQIDLLNPTPGLGWQGTERMSLFDRGPADAVLALALLHHLSISGNVPFGLLAEGFARMGAMLVIEFIPKEDPQVQRLLRSREDVFGEYSEAAFRAAFATHFDVLERSPLGDSGRALYLMRRGR